MTNLSDISTPLISVIMSVYNDEKYIHDSINSILNQSYSNIEFLIMNDHSTDNSVVLFMNILKKTLELFIFKNEHNKG